MKQKVFLFCIFAVINTLSVSAISGSGSYSDPYLISSAEDLVTFRNWVNNGSTRIYGKLMADIDLSSVCSASKGSWVPIGNGNPNTGSGYLYAGQFNGNYHTISGLYINASSAWKGLFGTITGLVYRLTVTGTITINNTSGGTFAAIGGIVGENKGGRIASCTNMCSISGRFSYSGGIVGINKGTIYNCINEGTLSPSYGWSIGGIAGETYPSTSIEDCINNGTITTFELSSGGVGGIVGSLTADDSATSNISIIRCTNNGYVSGERPGGIIGHAAVYWCECTIDQCVNTGQISGTSAGGIACTIGGTTIQNCYNMGTITASGTNYYQGVAGGIAACYSVYDDENGENTITSNIHHCYNAGTIIINNSNQAFNDQDAGGIFSSDNLVTSAGVIATISDCYCLEEASLSAGGGVFKDANAFQNGEVAYLLQQGQNTQVWGQSINTDSYPLLSSDATKKVFQTTFKYNNDVVAIKYRNKEFTESSFLSNNELEQAGITGPIYYYSYNTLIYVSYVYNGDMTLTIQNKINDGQYSYTDLNGLTWAFELRNEEAYLCQRAENDEDYIYCCVTSGSNLPTTLTIPSVVRVPGLSTEFPIVGINMYAFTDYWDPSTSFDNVTAIYVPTSIYVANDAFYGTEEKVIRFKDITFSDARVKKLCITNWDTGDGWFTPSEAQAVTSLRTVFKSNETITSFKELVNFKGLTSIGDNAFYGCTGLTSVTIPENVTSIETGAFYGCI